MSGANAERVENQRKKEKHIISQSRSKSKNARKPWSVDHQQTSVIDLSPHLLQTISRSPRLRKSNTTFKKMKLDPKGKEGGGEILFQFL